MLEHDPGFRARRWVVEVVHSFMNRFRKLLVRCEKKAVNYLALVQFACAIIVWRNLIPDYGLFGDKLLRPSGEASIRITTAYPRQAR